jgi:hypothetical protein
MPDDKKPEDTKPTEKQAEKAATDKPIKHDLPKPLDPSEGLLKVKKGDQTLHIHPAALKSHKTAGWHEV